MRQFVSFGFTLLTALTVTASAASAADCGWLATSELDRHFPQYAPWQVTVGGAVGRCQFHSRPGQPPNVFGANQMIRESAAAAADTVAKLRAETAKTYETKDRPELGEQGFSYFPRDTTAAGPRSVNLVGHRGRVVVVAVVSLQSALGEKELQAADELVTAALAVADDPEALTAAADCPWLDAAAFKRLLPAGGVTQQTFGENSCMAEDSANAVLLVSAIRASPDVMGRRDGTCTWEELPGLGPGAVLGHSCTGNTPRATLRMMVGANRVEYNLTSGSEPSEGQRRALVDLATAVRQRLDR